jgi:streptogramin lyase
MTREPSHASLERLNQPRARRASKSLKILSGRGAKYLLLAVLVVVLASSTIQMASPPASKADISTGAGTSTFTLSDAYRMVLHTVPTNDSGPWGITVDSQGVVWFLEQNANKLGSYDPAADAFKEFLIPTARSTPVSVVTDADGNVWFTELSSSKLAELPKGGSSIIEHSVPSLSIALGTTSEPLSCGPGAIIVDASGSIWFACLFSNQIDEYVPGAGTFESFDLPVFPSGPAGLLLDGKGNIWFTAADADMLGKAIVSQLRNGTSDGITEFAPLNQTYIFQFSQQTSLLGGSTTVKSSLPTPSGIAMDSEGRLWVTEHVDSSFDSYDPATGSLVRYWTSQTHDAYGFSVTFPNGIAVAKDGTVWIAEHYGNRVAEFNPADGQLTEYPASCCFSSFAAVYELALAGDGTPWFVEIQGNAIGELVPTTDSSPVSASLQTTASLPGAGGSVVIPIGFSEANNASGTTRLSLDVSGISGTGAPQNMTASFSPSSLAVAPGTEAVANLTLVTVNLPPGVYYLTLTANASPQNALFSVILRLTVTGGNSDWLLPALIAATVLVVLVAFVSRKRLKPGRSGPRR